MEMIPGAHIGSSGLQVERTRMEVAAHNLANAHTTKGPDGTVFRRSQVLLEAVSGDDHGFADALAGVRVAGLVDDPRPPREVYAPSHPDADASGIVRMPAISPMEEMLDMITASRSYEANLSVLKQGRSIAERTIDLLRPNS